jgi:hypothetical protein
MMIVGRPFFPDSRLREYRDTREGPTIIVKHGPFYILERWETTTTQEQEDFRE